MIAALAAGALLLATPAEEIRDLLRGDRWEEAGTRAERALAESPGDPDLLAARAEALWRAGRPEEAEALVEPLLGGEPPPRALLVAGRARLARGREGEGAALLERALAAAPGDREVLYAAAEVATPRGRAVERLERWLAGAEAAGEDRDRVDGVKGTLALYRALGDRPVWVPVEAPVRTEIPLRPLPDGRGGAWGYVIDARVGEGRPVPLLLDTGSTGLFVVERAVRKRGFTELAEETVFGGGEGGRAAARRGLLPGIALGGLVYRDALVVVSRREIEPTGLFHGVIGLQAFEGYRATLDLAHRKIVLERIPAGAPPAAGARAAWTVAGQWLVRATTPEGTEGLFLLDTGARESLLSRSFVKRIPGAREGADAVVQTWGGGIPARRVGGVTLTCGAWSSAPGSLPAADLSQRSRLGGIELSGFLGLDVLGRGGLVVDTAARTVAPLR